MQRLASMVGLARDLSSLAKYVKPWPVLLLSLILIGCSSSPQVQLNGVYSGYIRSDAGSQLTAALAVKNEGSSVNAGFAANTSSGIVSFPMQGTLSGDHLSLRYSDSSGSMSIDANASPSLIEGRFTLTSSSGSVSGRAYFTYSRPLSNSVSQQVTQEVADLYRWLH